MPTAVYIIAAILIFGLLIFIHTAGLAILMLLMIFICVKDVIKLF